MTWCVHQVQNIGFPIICLVGETHSLGLNRNAAFALNIHVIKNLIGHFAFSQTATILDQAISDS